MAHGITLELREIPGPTHEVVDGTEVAAIWRTRKVDGERYISGWSRPMPYNGPSRDRSLPGKARIRARRNARKAGI